MFVKSGKITELNVAVTERDKKIETLTNKGDTCNVDKSALEGKIAGLEKSKRSLKMKVDKLENTINSMNESLKVQAVELDSQISGLNQQLSAAGEALKAMSGEHEACKGREHECVSEKDKHAKDVARLTAEIQEAMTQRTSLHEQVQALTAKSGDQTKQLEA